MCEYYIFLDTCYKTVYFIFIFYDNRILYGLILSINFIKDEIRANLNDNGNNRSARLQMMLQKHPGVRLDWQLFICLAPKSSQFKCCWHFLFLILELQRSIQTLLRARWLQFCQGCSLDETRVPVSSITQILPNIPKEPYYFAYGPETAVNRWKKKKVGFFSLCREWLRGSNLHAFWIML